MIMDAFIINVNGKAAVQDGKFIGEATRGKFLKREPNHF